MQINRLSKSRLFKMFVHKCNFLQLSLEINAIFFNFLVQRKLALLISILDSYLVHPGTPVSLLNLFHKLISRELSSDHHDEILDRVFLAVHIEKTSYHHWETRRVHLRGIRICKKNFRNFSALLTIFLKVIMGL